jgi:hypothetical protein
MPDSPNKRLSLPKSHSVAIITRSQEEAARQLRLAGVPEQRIALAVQQIGAALLTALQEQTAFYQDVKATITQSGTDADIAPLIQERGTAYQHVFDTAVAEIVREIVRIVVQSTIAEFQHPPVREQPIIAVTPHQPGLRDWLGDALHTVVSLFVTALWLSGLVVGLLLSWFAGGSVIWAIFWSGVAVFSTWLLWGWLGEYRVSVLIPLTALVVLGWAFVF